jgi:hypothetical protein
MPSNPRGRRRRRPCRSHGGAPPRQPSRAAPGSPRRAYRRSRRWICPMSAEPRAAGLDRPTRPSAMASRQRRTAVVSTRTSPRLLPTDNSHRRLPPPSSGNCANGRSSESGPTPGQLGGSLRRGLAPSQDVGPEIGDVDVVVSRDDEDMAGHGVILPGRSDAAASAVFRQLRRATS